MICKNKKISVALAFILTFVMLLNGIAVQAAQKQAIVPIVDYINAPTLEYAAGDIVTFDLHAPNYGGKVQYRVLLWDDKKKEARDLWITGDRYYTNWMPYGNNTFNLHFRIDEPGSYRITVYIKRAGIANNNTYLKGQNCDSYMESQAFVVNAKTTAFDKDGQTYGSNDENEIEAYNYDINITGKDVTFNNAKLEGNLTITGDNVVISNVNIVGNIVIDPGKDGSCTLDNVTAKDIKVLSGGQNSIHIKDSSIETMNVNSQSPIRIEVDGDTEIVSTSASGYVIFDRKNGTYGTITITKDENGETVIEFHGDIQDKVEVETAATIRTGQGSSIANLVINTGNNTDIVKLEGKYGKVEISSNAKVEVGANTKIQNVIANSDAEIKLDKTSSITNVEKSGNEVVIIGEGKIGADTQPANNGSSSDEEDEDQAAPTGLAGIAPTTAANNDGKIIGTTTTMEYKLFLAEESAYTTCSAIEITGLSSGDYVVRYSAKAGYKSGATAAVTVSAYVAPKSTVATLSDLKIDGTTVTGFATDTFIYHVELSVGTTVVPTVTPTVTDTGKANAVVTPAASLPGATTIVVTAEDGTTVKTYTINFTVVPNQDQAAPTGLTGVAATLAMYKDGKITGTTTIMEFKLSSAMESAYVACSADETIGLSAGVYVVRYKAKTGFNPGATALVEVKATRFLYASNYTTNAIEKYSLVPMAPSEMFMGSIDNMPESGPMAIAASNTKLYWAGQDSRKIECSDLNGGNRTIVINDTGSTYVSGIAVDETNGRIYWSDYSGNMIKSSTLTGTDIRTVILVADMPIGGPRGLIISNQRLYWINDSTSIIGSCDLNGNDRNIIIDTGASPQSVNSIVIDEVLGKIYWNDYMANCIWSADYLTGNNRAIVIPSADKGAGFAGVEAIALYDGYIYWSCDSNGEIRRSKFNGTEEMVISIPGPMVYRNGLVIN